MGAAPARSLIQAMSSSPYLASGTPIAGPNVGVKFPTEDYVAVPISNDQIYITWLDPATYAIVDVFVMNLQTHTVYDYAPGTAKPESAGYITVVKWPTQGLPW